jgi:hypothetical protein
MLRFINPPRTNPSTRLLAPDGSRGDPLRPPHPNSTRNPTRPLSWGSRAPSAPQLHTQRRPSTLVGIPSAQRTRTPHATPPSRSCGDPQHPAHLNFTRSVARALLRGSPAPSAPELHTTALVGFPSAHRTPTPHATPPDQSCGDPRRPPHPNSTRSVAQPLSWGSPAPSAPQLDTQRRPSISWGSPAPTAPQLHTLGGHAVTRSRGHAVTRSRGHAVTRSRGGQ